MSAIRKTRGRYADLSFRCHFGQNGVQFLSPTMTPSAGGTSELPVFRFFGGDADGTDWTTSDYPGTPVACARQAVATPPTYNWGSPYLGADDDSVFFNGSDYYQAPNTSFGQVGTEDFVLEVVAYLSPSGAGDIITTRTGTGKGWRLYSSSATARFYFVVDDDIAGAVNISTSALTLGTWHHLLFFGDRSGSLRIYINGADNAGNAISGSAGSLDSGNALCIGADTAGAAAHTGALAYAALWTKSSWLTSHLNPDTAKQRFGLLAGYWPQVFKGTATPNTRTRAYAAYSEKIESGSTRLYYMGSEALRIAQRIDGNSETVTGYLAEPAATNDIDQSCTFAGYTLEDAGDSANDNNDTSPDNRTRMAALVCDSTDGNHGISDATPGNLSADLHCFSAYIGEGNATWVKLVNSTVANAHAWFNLSTGAVGTLGAGCSEAGFVGGAYLGPSAVTVRRPYIRFTGTAAPHTFMVRPVDANEGDTFSGGNGADVTLHLFGWQCEQGDYPTSLIETAGAAATRLKDQLQFKGDDGNLGGVGSEERATVEFMYLLPDTDAQADRHLLSLSDGGSSDDRINFYAKSDDTQSVYMKEATVEVVNTSNTGDVYDGDRHRMRSEYTTNDFRMMLDGTDALQDTACAVVDNIDRVDVCSSEAGVLQPAGLISDLKIWRRNKRR